MKYCLEWVNQKTMEQVKVVGAGLAGCEAAWQLAMRDIRVRLYEMKPTQYSPAHSSEYFAELVCSNSLKAERIENACGLLKEEMRLFGSLIMQAAEVSRVPAGGALAVDRDVFAGFITEKIREHPNIEVISEEVTRINREEHTIIATGPLTSEGLSEEIKRLTGSGGLYFYDAAAPVLTKESIDMEQVFYGARYDRGTPDYINCPMTREEYTNFYHALIEAETVPLKTFENQQVFEGCMPVEVMAKRGEQTLLFGPLKPVGLANPKTGRDDAYAVVQLRRDNLGDTLYNMVGFQTNLKWGEQKRVFSMIPGLAQADFVRYGVMHRNTYIQSPKLLNRYYQMKHNPKIFFAGQITGVEGYVESASSGILAGLNMARMLTGKPFFEPHSMTAIGSLPLYITNEGLDKLQPMNANFGIIDGWGERIRGKKTERYALIAKRSLDYLAKEIKNL